MSTPPDIPPDDERIHREEPPISRLLRALFCLLLAILVGGLLFGAVIVAMQGFIFATLVAVIVAVSLGFALYAILIEG